MASRAERLAPVRPAQAGKPAGVARLGTAVRTSLTDFYFASVRLVVANALWGIVLVLLVLVVLGRPAAGFVLLPFLAVPAAVVFRTAGRIVRAGDARTAPLLDRRLATRSLLVGCAAVAGGAILSRNLVTGLDNADPAAWGLATLAGWGLVAGYGALLVGWPLLVDPARDDRSAADLAALAGRILLTEPGRIAGLGLVILAIVAVSLVLTAAILTIGVAFAALVACRVVYPLADRLDPIAPC